MTIRYRNKYRPVQFCTIPKVHWEWVEVPPYLADRAEEIGKPVSEWRFGIYTTERPLTEAELYGFEIEALPPPPATTTKGLTSE